MLKGLNNIKMHNGTGEAEHLVDVCLVSTLCSHCWDFDYALQYNNK